jgi:hypothetical protein
MDFAYQDKLFLCIHDDRLALMTSFGHQILVWDWKTGKQVAKIASLVLSRNSDLLTMCRCPSRATMTVMVSPFLIGAASYSLAIPVA